MLCIRVTIVRSDCDPCQKPFALYIYFSYPDCANMPYSTFLEPFRMKMLRLNRVGLGKYWDRRQPKKTNLLLKVLHYKNQVNLNSLIFTLFSITLAKKDCLLVGIILLISRFASGVRCQAKSNLKQASTFSLREKKDFLFHTRTHTHTLPSTHTHIHLSACGF